MNRLLLTNRQKRMRTIVWIPVVIWMVVIFCFSSQTAGESTKVSGKTIQIIAQKVYPQFGEKTVRQQQLLIQNLQHIVRKIAHFMEYTILGILVTIAFLPYKIKTRNMFLVSLFGCVLYASSDEFHQMFVPGRGPGVRDVLIDSCGALFGIIIILSITHRNKMKKHT
jgi:Predicted integral membrane protein